MQRLVPAPAVIEPSSGVFTLTADTVIAPQAGNDDVKRIADYLASLIGTAAAPTPPRVDASGTATTGVIQIALASLPDAGDEGYELTISPERINLTANRPAGLFYGVQTLRQLLPVVVEHPAAAASKGRTVTVPAGRIVDRPRFAWRGAMLDVARHFFGPDDVKRYIDLIAHAQDQSPAPASLRRSGLAHRDQVLAEPDETRRQHGSGRRRRRLLHAGDVRGARQRTQPSATSPSCPRSTCPATPTPRWRRTPS